MPASRDGRIKEALSLERKQASHVAACAKAVDEARAALAKSTVRHRRAVQYRELVQAAARDCDLMEAKSLEASQALRVAACGKAVDAAQAALAESTVKHQRSVEYLALVKDMG